MAILTEGYCNNIYEKLEYNFLYNNDLNSIHILLNLYDIDKSFKNIHPKYISVSMIKDEIDYVLRHREDKDEIIDIVREGLHEDINRLELFACIEGYKGGYYDKNQANILETITIKSIPIEKIYEKEQLFKFEYMDDNSLNLPNQIFNLINNLEESKNLNETTKAYLRQIIIPKIYEIDSILYEKTGRNLSREDIDMIKDGLIRVIYSSVNKLYKESYWYGLNDRVLKRYR